MTHESFDADEFDDLKFELPPLPPEAEAPMREFLDKIRTPLASGEPRRHHFLPQFFLRRFANENNQLAVVRLDDPDIYDVTNVENVAVMKDLYTTIDAEIGETAAVEKMLAVADGEAKKAIARLAFGLFFPPQGVDRANLAIWFGLLHVRDPYTRRRMEALADQIYKLDLSIAKDAEAAHARLRKNMGKEPDDEEVKALVEAASNLDSFEVSPHQTCSLTA